jgi:glutamine---fructose-6-phosphate transaminase (isomerizing)
MCGIVGYVGSKDATPILLQGLKRLEYRGYDSAGVALLNGGDTVHVVKRPGKIRALEDAMRSAPSHATCGIAHTRWATHGAPNETNAHPHVNDENDIAVVHNGIIENAGAARRSSRSWATSLRGARPTRRSWSTSSTRRSGSNESLEDAVAAALLQVEGAYGIAVVSARDPGKLVAARNGSPLLLGIGKNGENLIGSDAAAVIAHTRDVVYLDDGDYAVLRADGYETYHLRARRGQPVRAPGDVGPGRHREGGLRPLHAEGDLRATVQLRDVMRGRLLEEEGSARLGGMTMEDGDLLEINRIIITACGTSWHSGLIGEYMLEELARIPTEVEYASEFRYKNPVLDEGRSSRGQPVRRDRGHARRAQGGEAAGRHDDGHRERGGLLDRARDGLRRVPARRPRDRSRVHQGLHEPGGRPRPLHALPGAPAQPLHPRRAQDRQGAAGSAGPGGSHPRDERLAARTGAGVQGRTELPLSGGGTSSPSPSRAR